MEQDKQRQSVKLALDYKERLLELTRTFVKVLNIPDELSSQKERQAMLHILKYVLLHIKSNAPISLGCGICCPLERAITGVRFSEDCDLSCSRYERVITLLGEVKSSVLLKLGSNSDETYPIYDLNSRYHKGSRQFAELELSYGRQAELRLEYIDKLIEEINILEGVNNAST